ncbi:semaphorin-7A-like [Notechis scutatus]|uniref:Semaphorin-1A n=1 Tax=Notechis scutatus TaxID=8663 RepID=A0A6J1VT35_9SAUR|nr:semaphorin-7A-like [Notechis scutatus]
MGCFFPLFCLFAFFYLGASQNIPRLRLIPKDAVTQSFNQKERLTAMFHEAGSPQLIVGGRGTVWILTFVGSEITPTEVPVRVEEKAEKDCKRAEKGDCDNFIQMIERIENKTLVCGTNAGSPKCWLLVNTSLQRSSQGQIFTMVGENVVSSSPLQNAVTIAIEDSLYSALSGNKSSFQRSYGRKKGVKTRDSWISNAEFEGAALFPHKDRRKDEIFFFYNEVNRSAGLDEELYKVWLGRVCKVDQGEKPGSGDFWSTFLKARLVCGRPHEPLLFHRLEDAFVFREEGQAEATLYGVFSSPWGSSAVCSYSMKRISSHFETSKFKDAPGSIPHPRPGLCVPPDSSSSLAKMLAFIKDHPELEAVVYPDEEQPLYVLQMNDTYTQVVVDKVRDANNVSHDVLFLGTAKGKIHKVLRSKEQTVIIAELSPFKGEAPVTQMILDAATGHLYVSTKFEVTRLPLHDCSQYNGNCWKCILAQDPYCGWDAAGKSCSAISQKNHTNRLIQSLDSSSTTQACKAAEEKLSQDSIKKVSVDHTAYIYLPCPLRSHHASYSWVKDNKFYPCAMEDQSCTLRFGQHTPMGEGLFKCMAREKGYKEEIMGFEVALSSGVIPELALMLSGAAFLTITILLL